MQDSLQSEALFVRPQQPFQLGKVYTSECRTECRTESKVVTKMVSGKHRVVYGVVVRTNWVHYRDISACIRAEVDGQQTNTSKTIVTVSVVGMQLSRWYDEAAGQSSSSSGSR